MEVFKDIFKYRVKFVNAEGKMVVQKVSVNDLTSLTRAEERDRQLHDDLNQATIRKVNETWDKSLNQLNCHLHPLDTIASTCRSTMKSLETSQGEVYGNDCVIANIVFQVNKLCYKDGKGDPKGFKTFLEDNNLPKGLIPRYRGNRLHILFHICGILFHHYDLFLDFFTTGSVTCGGLVSSIKKDYFYFCI